ncbi:hypothetical protein HOG17_01410 [Candidatus Peregrinibacteria bacterium]|jgi:hypothetical protein|nr:hypothetical protein [Candidatus Peregrinibacteria bacterium]MBT4148390.1 hypothetical protein [Candidatus Peregrinibacteria bacterium]MBT4365876.1 hypothetical protein [Candidatus Peregrinibacteria bacterium]MBT4456507.1 hypothetical protein [Candidatus Peregrinibacteria bacterium]
MKIEIIDPETREPTEDITQRVMIVDPNLQLAATETRALILIKTGREEEALPLLREGMESGLHVSRFMYASIMLEKDRSQYKYWIGEMFLGVRDQYMLMKMASTILDVITLGLGTTPQTQYRTPDTTTILATMHEFPSKPDTEKDEILREIQGSLAIFTTTPN